MSMEKKLMVGGLLMASGLFCMAQVAMAQQPGSMSTVVAKDTIPGNGDVNADGVTDDLDALIVAQMVKWGGWGADHRVVSVKGHQQGDANQNGRLDKNDADLIAKHHAGLIKLPSTLFKPGDANGDGKIDIGDALLVAQFLENKQLRRVMSIYNADATQDYFVDERDTLCIQNIDLGKSCYAAAGGS